MEKWEIWPPLPPKPLNRSSPKFAWLITSGPLPLSKISSRSDYPFSSTKYAKIRIKAPWLVFGGRGGLRQRTAKTPAPIFTINTSTDVVPHKDSLLGVSKTKFYFNPMLSTQKNNFDGTSRRFSAQKGPISLIGPFWAENQYQCQCSRTKYP